MKTWYLSIIIGIILDFFIGDPHFMPHIVKGIGWLISKSEKLIRKILPKTKNAEIIGGVFIVLIVLFFSVGSAYLIMILAGGISIILAIILESILCFQLLATKSLKYESMKVYKELKTNDLTKARYAVSMIVGRDTNNLTHEGITKAAVETIAENTCDRVIAPLFYMFIGGPLFGLFYKTINTMDSMIGYKNEKYLYFGKVAARLDDVMNFIPARLSAFFMLLAAMLLRYDWRNGFKIYFRDRKNHKSPNSAQTEAVCAGALNVQLAGDAWYFGKLCKKDTIGDNNRQIDISDIIKANRLLYLTTILSALVFMLLRIGLVG